MALPYKIRGTSNVMCTDYFNHGTSMVLAPYYCRVGSQGNSEVTD
jgi:hypothetical protein